MPEAKEQEMDAIDELTDHTQEWDIETLGSSFRVTATLVLSEREHRKDALEQAIAKLRILAALPEPEPSQGELLTLEQVLAEVDRFCAADGYPLMAKVVREHHARTGNIVQGALASLNLEPVKMWRRK